MITAIIFAGGSGLRMKSTDLPKQFLEVGGKPIIVHVIEYFEMHMMVDAIVIACKANWIEYLNVLIRKYGLTKVVNVVPGGETGFQSIHKGIIAVSEFSKSPEDIVLICDGVRPMLSQELISNCIMYTKRYQTAVPVIPSIDSILFSPDGKTCDKSYDRNTMYITQAPQGYTMRKILWAHKEALKRGIINPVSSSELLIELGEKVHLFQGERFNIKVTTQEDLISLRAQFYYQNYKQFAKEELKYL